MKQRRLRIPPNRMLETCKACPDNCSSCSWKSGKATCNKCDSGFRLHKKANECRCKRAGQCNSQTVCAADEFWDDYERLCIPRCLDSYMYNPQNGECELYHCASRNDYYDPWSRTCKRCQPGFEVVDGCCTKKCPANQSRNAEGKCRAKCKRKEYEDANGNCQLKCPAKDMKYNRKKDSCVPKCKSNQELVSGKCRPKCDFDEHRVGGKC